MRLGSALVLASFAVAGCTSPPPHDPVPCEETARRLADHNARCGDAWLGDEYSVLSCDRASPRDRELLEEECWPALESAPCSITHVLPEACRDQF